ncbi:GcrA family cell cycle regulator [Segnochrobactrum spirostomi]|uniref:GcrA cell cycle regulator n=1 Tax=Segnochrobactrum spirostomi TaxID=2608987 RepID=A0A6A7Y3I6_9HYPH|nr:GcrA family cell cycle regulator [Segnochrobactrum spirostomi]MQT13680.1 hypothetical protein [Segnochrobactrum spirostomi]
MSLWSSLSPERKVEAVRGALAAGESYRQMALRLGTTRGALAGFIHFHSEVREPGPMLVGGGGAMLLRIRLPAVRPEPFGERPGFVVLDEFTDRDDLDPAAKGQAEVPGAEPASAPVAAPAPTEIPATRLAAARIVQTRQLTLLEVCDGYCRWPMWSHAVKPTAAQQFVCSAAAPMDRPYCAKHAGDARRTNQAEPF